MAHPKIKFKMTLKELSFEFEGDADTGQRLQSDIRKSLTALGQTQERLLPPPEGEVIDVESSPAHTTNGKGNKARSNRPRRSKANTPRALIIGLRKEGFFAEKREINQIQEELAKKAHNFKQNEISSALVGLVRKNILKRDQGDEGGNYQYEAGDADVDAGGGEDAE